ncbi:hypothetical protein NPIL_368311 [Nephila pilipes]|uniref:Uncharacterized protein n=1 Tax=Nephila pilipes TaxID=299642 RepID=A0A8X6R2V5_NEPPI|nr:hypothetical protein NPIL_368311 [Nephila pilipes]
MGQETSKPDYVRLLIKFTRSSNVKKGNFTFRNNVASRMPHHVMRTPLKPIERYGTPRDLKTPLLTNETSSNMNPPYEAPPMNYDESYGMSMDTTSFDTWGTIFSSI